MILIMLLWGSLTALANVLVLLIIAIAPGVLNENAVALLVPESELRSVADVPWLVARVD